MAVKKVIKTDISVKVNLDTPILLTITIGNAQIGGNVVRWKNSQTILAKGEIKNLNLGLGVDIRGKTLKVTTNVLDVNEATNGIVINHYFYNGSPSLFTYEDRVEKDGDILQLITEYTFK
jgi:hypothetical protein